MADEPVPDWLTEGAPVVHRRSGPGEVCWVRWEWDGVWVAVGPLVSGPIVAYRLKDAVRELRPRRPDEMSDEELEELDWRSARFHPLADDDPALAAELAGLLVDAFLTEGGLDTVHRDEALAQVSIESGVTPAGVRILRTVKPLATGVMETEWDGTAEGAREIVVTAGETAGATLEFERRDGVLTGWELEDR